VAVDVVIVTAGSSLASRECLRSLEDSQPASITVVDNGSLEPITEAGAADVLRLEEPRSLSYAYNRGAETGKAEAVLFLNDDIVATPGAVELLERMLRERNAVAMAGRLVDADTGATQVDYQPRRFPTAASLIAALAGLDHHWPRNALTGAHRRRPSEDQGPRAVDYAPGACLLVRRDVFERIGGWDETYSFWYEDVDLAARLRPYGPLVYVPAAAFRHVGGLSARKLSRAEIIDRSYSGILRYTERHLGGWQARVVGATFAAAASAKERLVGRSDPELAAAYGDIAAKARHLAFERSATFSDHVRRASAVRRVVEDPRVEPLVAVLLRASTVREAARFAARELVGRPLVARYRLRHADGDVLIRHGTADAAVLGEVFYNREYAFPGPVLSALQSLGRPPLVIDVGANIGLFGLWVLHYFPEAEIVSFEPDPANAEILRRCVSLNDRTGRWSVVAAAAATREGTVDFSGGGTSFSRVKPPDGGTLVVSTVDVIPYMERADLVKVDIEGGEWELLEDERFDRVRPTGLVIEYHPHLAPTGDPAVMARRFLERAGLHVEPISQFAPGHGMLWSWQAD
jgi:N-acetylglucosaminyl-diphospho-decaprenol L-rhamnosyltransferase